MKMLRKTIMTLLLYYHDIFVFIFLANEWEDAIKVKLQIASQLTSCLSTIEKNQSL
jgi:hypothetical protein